jgi:hypothetical protein
MPVNKRLKNTLAYPINQPFCSKKIILGLKVLLPFTLVFLLFISNQNSKWLKKTKKHGYYSR